MEKFRIEIIHNEEIGVHEVWRRLFPILQKHLRLKPTYEARMKKEINEKSLEEIHNYYSNPNNKEVSFSLDYDDENIHEYIAYFEIRKSIAIHIPNSEYNTNPRSLADELTEIFKFSNQLNKPTYNPDNYSPWWSPPNSNLYQAPILTNLRDYYIEGVSAEMWLGEAFWQYASCSKEELMGCDWLETEERANHLYLKAWPEPFTRVDGKQGEVQRRLLKLLFDVDENRPHGLAGTPEEQAEPKTFVQKVQLNPDGSTTSLGGLEEKT